MTSSLLRTLVALAFAVLVTANLEKSIFFVEPEQYSTGIRKWHGDLIERGIEVLSV